MAEIPEDRLLDLPSQDGGEEYEQLLDDYSHFAPPSEVEILQGHVLKVHEKDVIVDVGYKSEGIIPISDFTLPDGTVSVQPGDAIDCMVDRHAPHVEGYITLSHQRAALLRCWDT